VARSDTRDGRDLRRLPKAHLHLHFTGAMRHATLLELAAEHGVRLPDALTSTRPVHVPATDERGWFRFQRLYDAARSVLRREDDVRRLLHEVAEDERADGSGWLEIQVDPSGYAGLFGGVTAFTELVLDAARDAAGRSGVGIAVIVAANRTRHPLDARTLARLATQYAGHGVVGFGLSNDERRGRAEDFEAAFRIAGRAGLLAAPHAGELVGAPSVRAVVERLGAGRVGHGVRAAEDPAVLDLLASRGVACEVCPASNVALGVYRTPAEVPVTALRSAGVTVALGADDPLLFGARLTEQYALVGEAHGLDDHALAGLARASVVASRAPDHVRARLLAEVDAWLVGPAEAAGLSPARGSSTPRGAAPV
jgi:adenosine deaminase